MPDTSRPILPLGFNQRPRPSPDAPQHERHEYFDWYQRAPSRQRVSSDEERRALVLGRLRLRERRRASNAEDFRRYLTLFGPDIQDTTSDYFFEERRDMAWASDQSPPLPGETFTSWRDRALWDFVRPDLSSEQRRAVFMERRAKVQWVPFLRAEYGRYLILVPPPVISAYPLLEKALVEDRKAAGDLVVPYLQPVRHDSLKGGYYIFPWIEGLFPERWDRWSPATIETIEQKNAIANEEYARDEKLITIGSEDYTAYWAAHGRDEFGSRQDLAGFTFRDGVVVPAQPVASTANSPPRPGESFAAWRDRAFWDYVRPDLTGEQRLAAYRARLARVPSAAYLRPARGRWFLFFPHPRYSCFPQLEQAFIEERRAAGDSIRPLDGDQPHFHDFSWIEQEPPGTLVTPPLREFGHVESD